MYAAMSAVNTSNIAALTKTEVSVALALDIDIVRIFGGSALEPISCT
jgi:hypothetical protein